MAGFWTKGALAAALLIASATYGLAAGTEPEETPAATPAPAVECKETDKSKCPAAVAPVAPVECKEADKSKCPAVVAPAAPVECKEADKSRCPPPADPAKKQSFIDDYHAAVALIEAGRYDEALVAMRALDDGTSADVVNYIGYIHRKMGKMAEAQMYYEAALHMKPDHRGALEYYGEWYVMMGRVDKARENLARIATVYGADTKEYAALAHMIDTAQKS